MKVAFDTSVLVAAAMINHPHHARARVWIDAAAQGVIDGVTCAHALAELYSVLTKLPTVPRVSPIEAEAIVTSFGTMLGMVAVTGAVATRAVARCAKMGAVSGAIFDATHLLAAEAVEAEIVLTFNTADFQRLAVVGSPRVVEPPDPPSLTLDSAAPGQD